MDIIIKNLRKSIPESKIEKLFQKYGSVKTVKKKKRKDFAIVIMADPYQAKRAILALNGSRFLDKRIRVEELK